MSEIKKNVGEKFLYVKHGKLKKNYSKKNSVLTVVLVVVKTIKKLSNSMYKNNYDHVIDHVCISVNFNSLMPRLLLL